MIKRLFIFPLLSFIIVNSPMTFAKTCILSMFESSSKEAKTIDTVFSSYIEADLFKLAQIRDIEKCFFSGDYDEIIWISHGSSLRDGLSAYSAPILVKPDGSKITLPKRFFLKLISQSNYENLKKVRINLCGLDFSKKSTEMLSTIDPFIKELEQQNVEVDLSKKFAFGSWILKENVTRLDPKWLMESIKLEDSAHYVEWKTNHNSHCTTDKTLGCDRSSAKYVLPLSPMRDNQ